MRMRADLSTCATTTTTHTHTHDGWWRSAGGLWGGVRRYALCLMSTAAAAKAVILRQHTSHILPLGADASQFTHHVPK